MPTVFLEWWGDRGNVADLYRWLRDEARLPPVDEVGDLIERPWKWTPEWNEMQAARAADNEEAPTAA